MKVKKQLTLLASLIICIPLCCIIFLSVSNYIKSSKRVLISGYHDVKKLDATNLNELDMSIILRSLKNLPEHVELVLFDNSGNVILSTIKEFPLHSSFLNTEIWEKINKNRNKYYYQFSSIPLTMQDTLLITRVPRQNKDFNKSKKLLTLFTIILFLIVFFCIFLILKVSKNITNSINIILRETNAIANGDLSVEIKSSSEQNNEIISISESLEKMRTSLLEVQKQKSNFIMGISHDLRTPVAVIKGYTEAMSDGLITDEEEISKTLDLISSKTNQLQTMIDTLINYTKMNTTELRNSMQVSSITEFLKDIINEQEKTGDVFRRTIISTVSFDKDVSIPFDKQLATRVFENLFYNAIRYTSDNDTISLSAWIEDNFIYYEIADTGIGIDEKDLTNIFEMFYRGTNSRRESGLGIGLSVVKNIIDTHGWFIEVSSKKDEGTVFTIKIPFNNE